MRHSRIPLALLLAVSAAVFAIGVSVERSQSKHHDAAAPAASGSSTPQAPEGSSEREAAETHPPAAAAPAAPSTEVGGESTEKIFGVNTESIGAIVVVVIASLLFAAVALAVRSPLVLALVIVFALTAAVFDIREVAHQIDESRNGVATLAALTTALHVLVALVAAASAFLEQRGSASSGTDARTAG